MSEEDSKRPIWVAEVGYSANEAALRGTNEALLQATQLHEAISSSVLMRIHLYKKFLLIFLLKIKET